VGTDIGVRSLPRRVSPVGPAPSAPLGREELALSDSPARPEPANAIDPTVAAIVRHKACRLVGRAGLRPQDREDLEQQLVVHILEQLQRFDPARGTWPAFVQRLVERFGQNLVRSLRAHKRNSGPLAQLFEEEPAGAEQAPDLDLTEALVQLPEDLRAVAELLVTQTQTVAGAARTLGVSRSTVHARVRELRSRRELKKLLPDP
jgi:RNA polymerase sigma factor (sigma-70 family)